MVLDVNGPRRVPHSKKSDRAPHDLAGRAATVDARNAVKVERSIDVRAPREKLYAFWRDVRNQPRFMKYLQSVEPIDAHGQRSRWTMALPGGRHVEWVSEIVNDEPNQLIAWKTVEDSDVAHAGSVHFEPCPKGGTTVRWVMDYEPPSGRSARMVSKLLGLSPEQLIDEDLRRFKQLMESNAAG
jgi:uncharacterized membrane protein